MKPYVKPLFLVLTLQCVLLYQAPDAYSDEKAKRVDMLVESAEKLYETERKIIESVDETRTGAELESAPLAIDLYADVIYLLESAIHLDKYNLRANYLLGKVYYQQRDAAYEINPDAVLKSKRYLTVASNLCQKQSSLCTNDIVNDVNQMLEVINWKASHVKSK